MSRQAGAQAEKKVRHWLERQGLTFVSQNYHSRFGELDLVMRDADIWVCIEVKARSHSRYGHAAEQVSVSKIKKLHITFEQYILARGLNPNHTAMRIDVVALTDNKMQWIKNIA